MIVMQFSYVESANNTLQFFKKLEELYIF